MLWIDRATSSLHDEAILIEMWSGGVHLPRRMSRAAYRDFIECGKRMLDEADRHDQEEVAHIGKPAKRTKRRKPGKHS